MCVFLLEFQILVKDSVFQEVLKVEEDQMNFHNKRLDTTCVLGEEDISITFEKIKKIDIIYS